MFKLESYITPILLNYVAKYVKNIRDEDAQVSLWEGEATFQNLDLRLDVLEEELNLPVELVSGHIHELSIQVPWTKLTSEPVRIEINTIEFVAKMPNKESQEERMEERRARKANMEEPVEQSPAAGGAPASSSGVVNKIINNINLQCHNIILKYVEDDIVVSMNVQYLNFCPADDKWLPAMVDVNPTAVLMRKLLQISDLTICLDKRNTAGRIEVCQEPVLYRCTLECRVLLKYNVNTASTSSTTRIGVLTKSLDINVSSLQLPLAMKLLKMLLELKPSAPQEDILSFEKPAAPPNVGPPQQNVINVEQSSMFKWAWNLLPIFEPSPATVSPEDPIGHAFDIGVYAESLNFSLKNSELFTDQAMGGIKRIRYTPILRISLGGIYYERSQLKESNWTNVRAGLSSLFMEPMGVYRSEDPIDRSLLNTKEFNNDRGFIDKSLFDEHYSFADRTWCGNNHDDYFARNTDEYMLYRSPVLAFDIVEYYQLQPENTRVPPRMQVRDLGLRIKYRVLSAGITFHFSQSFLQVKNVISDLLRPYDYPGYHADSDKNVKLKSPVSRHEEYRNEYMTFADYEYLIGFVPTCNYKIELRNMTVQFYPRQQGADRSNFDMLYAYRLSTTVNQSLLPYLQLKLSLAQGTICGPVNPKRLVNLITHLQDKPREIIDSCYNTYKFNLKNLTLTALNTTPDMGKAKLINIPSMIVEFNSLLMPSCWRRNVAALESIDIQTELITLECSKREIVILNNMINLIVSYDSIELSSLARLIADGHRLSDVIKLQTLLTKVRFRYRKYHTHLALLFSLRNLNTDVYHTMMNVRNAVLSTNKGINNKWLEIQVQLPREYSDDDTSETSEDPKPATALCVWMESFRLTIDMYLVQFLNSFELVEYSLDTESDYDTSQPGTRNPSYYSFASVKLPQADPSLRRTSRSKTRKVSVPAETVHLSSDKDDKLMSNIALTKVCSIDEGNIKSKRYDVVDLINQFCNMVLFMELTNARIDVCEYMMRKPKKDLNVEFTSIRLSRMRIKSGYGEDVTRANIRKIISKPNSGEPCNCIMELTDFLIYYRRANNTESILEPVRTTVTLALSQKAMTTRPPKPNQRLESFVDERNVDKTKSKKPKVDWKEKGVEEEPVPFTYSINVHVDMSAINIFGRRGKLLHEHFLIVCAVYTCLQKLFNRKSIEAEPRHEIEIYTGSADNYSIIREFLDVDVDDEPPANITIEDDQISLIFFCQWTIPRISIEMEANYDHIRRKVILNFEDLLLNVDKHADFNKITTKVENVSLNYYEGRVSEEWSHLDNIHIKMLGDSSNLPLLSVVVTTVNLQDLYSRIGARNLHDKHRTISEILIEIQPIEMIIDLNKIDALLLSHCELIEYLQSSYPPDQQLTHKQSLTTVQNLPIVHLNSKGIYVYIPLEIPSHTEVEREMSRSSVLLLRIESIKLTPTVENPLVRQFIRQDIYNKAAELNMLSTPGSLVEDRQYELSIRKISLSSGNWLQTQRYRLEETLTNDHSNPALEWNNQAGSPKLEHLDIFTDFDFITIYAPAISYDRFLVSGEIVEYNCVTDFVAILNTQQIQAITGIIQSLQNLNRIVKEVCLRPKFGQSPPSSQSNIKLSSEDSTTKFAKTRSVIVSEPARSSFMDAKSSSDLMLVGSCQSDSGINMSKHVTDSVVTQNYQLDSSDSRSMERLKTTYPRSVSFVAGKFEVQIHDVVELENELITRPVLLITISQPSFMSTQSLRATITQASIFNFSIHLAKVNTYDKWNNESKTANSDNHQFTESVFETQPGTLGSSGIPSPLLNIKTYCDRSNQTEVDVELRKPMRLRLCNTSIKLLASDVLNIYGLLHKTPYFNVRSERPVINATPLQQMKMHCFNADRLHIVCDRLIIKFFDESKAYNCTALFLDFNSNVKFSARPQKASVKSTLGAFFVKVGETIFLHPLHMRLSSDLLSESWSDELLITATLKLNVLQVDASILDILHLRKARAGLDDIMAHVNHEWQNFLRCRPSFGEPLNRPSAFLYKYQIDEGALVRSKSTPKPKAEFYQDDLRAGAFQFVYLNMDTMLPMPYQVQIIKKNYGIICWRYPQPRQMSSIHIYPVPMPVENPVHIKCRMEYFSDTHETFLHYCDFELSEVASKRLSPPERNISATIWRVVIMQSLISVDGTCFADDDEEIHMIDSHRVVESFKGKLEDDFILHPKVLVGCMRIDTTFQADLVPKVQLLLCCEDIELNLLNQPDISSELPSQLKSYKLKQTTQITQTFLTASVGNLQLHTSVYDRSNYSIETKFRSCIKCLDYGFLSMLDVMEPMNFHSYLNFNQKRNLLNANVLMNELRFNCSSTVIHTLLSSKHHWQILLDKPQLLHTLMPKCVVVNRLQIPVMFGQSSAKERITVEPNELRPFHFCNYKHSQELTFYIENSETNKIEISESIKIPLKFEEEHLIHHARIGNHCVTIKLGKLSASQVYILIKGQIELLSMVPFELLTEFRIEGKQYDEKGLAAVSYMLAPKGRSSVYQTVQRNEDVNMRLKLNASIGKGRTGDIPLKTNNSLPWLVKIPTQSPHQFISVWVRILREDIPLKNVEDDFQPQRILVSIWPIFQVRNLLSCDIKATESTTNEEFTIASKGGYEVLSTPTTHSTEHRVNFEFPCELGATSQLDYLLMLKSMDWHKFFYYDPAKWNIENTLNELDKSVKPQWPLNDAEELHVNRSCRLANTFDVQYRVNATRDFSCTLGLDISAWGMFINATGLLLSVNVPKLGTRYKLHANSLEMLPILNTHFTIDVPFGCNWIASQPICLNQQSQTELAASNIKRNILLRAESFVDIVIVRHDEVIRFILQYKVEDSRCVFKLRSKFVISNFTDVLLHALPLTMDHKETSSRSEVNSLDVVKNIRNVVSAKSSTSKKLSIGVTMEQFNDLNALKTKHTSDTAFVYFVCFALSGSQDISIPIPLAMPFTRRCFSLQDGSDSIPLMTTLIEKENVYYLNVFRDTTPAILICNNTNVNFIVAQTTASGNSNVTCTTSEFAGKHFEWNQIVAPFSKCYYTPPQMYANFPDVEFTMCNLSLAHYNDAVASGKAKIGWTKPIRTDKSWKKFLQVPHHGDIKIVVCNKHRVIRFNIYYITQQQEFSVKDLRSRLKMPNATEYRPILAEKREHNMEMSSLPDIDCIHFKNECRTELQLSFRMFIKSFVFSLQTNDRDRDYLKTEVCNMYADDVMLTYDNDDAKIEEPVLNLQLPNLQIDNQLYSSGRYDFPVLLCAQELYKRNNSLPQVYDLDAVYKHQAENVPISLFTFVFYQDELYLQSVRCKLQPLRVYIEDAYLNQLLDTLVECEPSNCVYTPHTPKERFELSEGQTILPDHVVAQALYIAEPLCLNSFIVEPLNLLLSVHTSSRLYIALDHSPLSFSRYERTQVLSVPLRFGQSLGLHYLSGAIFGAGWVVGSLEILGSPSGLARSFSTGLRDFISMPVQGLFRGPWGFVVGITQGSASLLRNVTAGTVNSVTKLAGSVARNLDRLTLDSEHIELTEARRRARPQGFADGLTQGLTGLGISLLGAVGGLAHHTLEARSSVGVLTGLTKGIVGALTKPISGAAEMLALTGQGVLHTVGFNTMPQQVQPSMPNKVKLYPSSYRIYRYLPEQLSSDQILFFQEITLMLKGQLRPALLYVSSSVLVIMETENDDLSFISPVEKVEISVDRDDVSKMYLSLKAESADDVEGQQLKYKNERIISFLNASRLHALTNDCLSDLFLLNEDDQEDPDYRQTQCIFFIKPNIGEHLIHYLKVIRGTQGS